MSSITKILKSTYRFHEVATQILFPSFINSNVNVYLLVSNVIFNGLLNIVSKPFIFELPQSPKL